MADTNLLTLLLKVQGGEASAAEIRQVQGALKQVEQEGGHLKERFQEGFQHIALKGFLNDAARSIGVGGEAGKAINLMNHGLTELGAAAGLTAGPMGLVVTGLAAVASLGFAAYQHFRKHSEGLEEVAKKQETALATTSALKTALTEYGEEAGKLPAKLRALATSIGELDEAQRAALNRTTAEQLAANQILLVANRDRIASEQARLKTLLHGSDQEKVVAAGFGNIADKVNATTKTLRELEDEQKNLIAQNDKMKADMDARRQGYADAKAMVEELAKAHKELNQVIEDGADGLQEYTAAESKDNAERAKHEEDVANKVEAVRRSLTQRTLILKDEEEIASSDAEARKQAEIKKFSDSETAVIEDHYRKGIEAAQGSSEQVRDIEQAKSAALIQLARTVAAQQKQSLSDYQRTAASAGQQIANASAQSAARAILGAKDAGDAIIATSKMVAEQVIAELIRIEVTAKLVKSALNFFDPAAAAQIK